MANVNQATIIGYIGDEPKVTTFEDGNKVVRITVATTENGYKTKDGRDIPSKTEWHNVILWRNLAKFASDYAHKGSLVYVQGKMRTRTYDAQDGSKKYSFEIEADNFQILEKRESSQINNSQQQYQQNTQSQQKQQAFVQQEMPFNVEQKPQRQMPTDFADMGEDLPF